MKTICGRLEVKRGKLYLDGRKTNFWLTEWVDRYTYKMHGDYAIHFLDPDTVGMVQFVRTWFGTPLTMNNWYDGGILQQRGHRSARTSVGADNSMHRFRLAGDVSGRVSADKMRDQITHFQEDFMEAGITRIEDEEFSPTWLHMDRKVTGLDYIQIVQPARSRYSYQEAVHINSLKN